MLTVVTWNQIQMQLKKYEILVNGKQVSNKTWPSSAQLQKSSRQISKIACNLFERILNFYTADRSKCKNVNMKQMTNDAHSTRIVTFLNLKLGIKIHNYNETLIQLHTQIIIGKTENCESYLVPQQLIQSKQVFFH
jgi:hypothetical protein